MKPEVPKSIKNGHKNLCSELKTIIEMGGDIEEKAKLLDNIMTAHFEKEEKYAFPPLGLLLTLSEGNWEIDSVEAIRMSEMLQTKLSELTNEHEDISKALYNLKNVAAENHDIKRFIKELMQHVEIEDQVLYPATILIGNYLKNLKLNH